MPEFMKFCDIGLSEIRVVHELKYYLPQTTHLWQPLKSLVMRTVAGPYQAVRRQLYSLSAPTISHRMFL
jgi:hypothetical protein